MKKKEGHFFVEDDVMARKQIEEMEKKKGKIVWHITQHRILLKFYDILDICLLVALIIIVIKIMQWLPW